MGPDVLMISADDGSAHATTLLTRDTFGQLGWAPDGKSIAYTACAYGEPCNLGLVSVDGRTNRLLTQYETNTSPYGGFDTLPFVWSGATNQIILGRHLSLFSLDPLSGGVQRIVTPLASAQATAAP